MSTDYRPGARRRSRSRHTRKTQDSPQKKQNPILAFFSKLFGGGTKTSNGHSAPYRKEGFPSGNKRSSYKERGHSSSFSQEKPKPTPPVEVTTSRLYVGNLSYDVAESDLFDLLVQAAPVRNVEIAREKRSNRSKGFGFAEMETLEGAKAVQAKFQGYELMGRDLVISGAKNRSETFTQS